MLFHRFGTLSHILASTELSCRKNEVVTDEVLIEKNAVAIVKVINQRSSQSSIKLSILIVIDTIHKLPNFNLI